MQTGVHCQTANGECEILDRVPDVVALALRETTNAAVTFGPSISMMPADDLTLLERVERLESMTIAPRWEHIDAIADPDGLLYVEADGARGVIREPHDNPEYTILDWVCPNGLTLPPHWHLQQEILIVTKGRKIVTGKGWKSEVLPGHRLVIDAFQIHESEAIPGTEFTVIFVPAHGIRKVNF